MNVLLDVLWLPDHCKLVLEEGEDPYRLREALGLGQKVDQEVEVAGIGLERKAEGNHNCKISVVTSFVRSLKIPFFFLYLAVAVMEGCKKISPATCNAAKKGRY